MLRISWFVHPGLQVEWYGTQEMLFVEELCKSRAPPEDSLVRARIGTWERWERRETPFVARNAFRNET